MEPAVQVTRAGLLSTVQDLGRPGLAHLGVPRSGAVDAASLRLANRLVGNAEDAAGIETTLLGADLRFRVARWAAVTGARGAVRVDGRPAAADQPLFVPAGSTLSVGSADQGVRAYVAIAGGIAVPPVLGSRSTDTLSHLGPAPLADGDVLPLGPVTGEPAPVDVVPRPAVLDVPEVRLIPGPRDDWFSTELLTNAPYTVSTLSDRVGVRLEGPVLTRLKEGELPSEGIVLGAVQVPANGQPLIFLADHPTTGGYPVVGVVHPADIGLVAQAAPGTHIRFLTAPA
jgi:biotin-dependent carboxylase-like uncharacterized protein